MTLDDFRRLNFREAGSWPLAAKIVILSIFALLILAAGAFFDWKDQFEALDAAKGEETRLREQYAQKKVKAINFELYVQQLKEVEQSFGALVKQLPNRAEIDALLTAELPISIRITGNYHDMGAFASDVAQLPRIVTLNDLAIANNAGVLSLDATAKTFRYLDEDEVARQRAATKGAKDKAKK